MFTVISRNLCSITYLQPILGRKSPFSVVKISIVFKLVLKENKLINGNPLKIHSSQKRKKGTIKLTLRDGMEVERCL